MSNGEELYSVRWRGKVTGPYVMEQLKELVAQGRLSRLHDVSTDQVVWQQADAFEALYPIYERRELEQTEAPAQRSDKGKPDRSQETSDQQWYYSIHGNVEGPCSTAAVGELVADGTLSGSDYVSRLENPEDWRFVMEVPEFDAARHSRAQPLTEEDVIEEVSTPSTEGRGLAVASLILAFVGICLMPLGILAIIFGGLARSRMNRAENHTGLALANIGIIIGIVDVVLLVLLVVAVVLFGWPPIPGL